MEPALGILNYGWNQVSNEILYWTGNQGDENMGAWGAKLYENDTALDIKDRFADLGKGKTVQQITNELIDEYTGKLDDVYCAPVFWFALADTQWNLGRLLPEVREQALAWLDKGGDLAVWQEENPELAVTREKVLRELQQKLNSPQPPEKKISQHRLYKCNWKIGDVFAYQFNSEYAKDNDFYQKYVYFVKVAENTWYPGHIVPIVYFYKKVDTVLSDITSLSNIDFIPQFYKPIAYKNNPGMKKQYLLTLLNTSSRAIPKNQLTFLGNVGNIKRVDNEDLNSYNVNWKRSETYMIDNFKAWFQRL